MMNRRTKMTAPITLLVTEMLGTSPFPPPVVPGITADGEIACVVASVKGGVSGEMKGSRTVRTKLPDIFYRIRELK